MVPGRSGGLEPDFTVVAPGGVAFPGHRLGVGGSSQNLPVVGRRRLPSISSGCHNP